MAPLTSVFSAYLWIKRKRNGKRKGYTGGFNWISKYYVLRKCVKEMWQNVILQKSWMVGVWVFIIFLILFCT